MFEVGDKVVYSAISWSGGARTLGLKSGEVYTCSSAKYVLDKEYIKLEEYEKSHSGHLLLAANFCLAPKAARQITELEKIESIFI